jgi:hypothetical protein
MPSLRRGPLAAAKKQPAKNAGVSSPGVTLCLPETYSNANRKSFIRRVPSSMFAFVTG